MKNINLLLPNPLLIYHEKFSPRIAAILHDRNFRRVDVGYPWIYSGVDFKPEKTIKKAEYLIKSILFLTKPFSMF